MFSTVDKCYQGIDWVTVTSSVLGNRTKSVALISETSEYLKEEIFGDIPRKTIKSGGKRHWVCGELTYKSNEYGNMLSVSGGKASEAWATLSTLVSDVHFSRLDLALDCALQTSAPTVLRAMYAYCTEHQHQSDKRAIPPVLISNDLGDTLYLGSRQSPLFLRIYDKSKEYGLQRGSVYRFETENKQHRGDRLAKVMAENSYNLADWITGQTVRDFESRGVGLPRKFARAENLPSLEVAITTDEATLRWYRRQVSPSVKRLLSNGVPRENVEKALGMQEEIAW